MNPFFFGPSMSPLFGVYHPAELRMGGSRGVLLCYPCGHEYMRVHRAYMYMARQLARNGCHVLRFDYASTGDSAGDTGCGTLSDWRRDVATAARELADMSGCTRLCCLGTRLGAAVLAGAIEDGLDVREVALWDPVVTGAAYMRRLSELHAARARAFAYAPRQDVPGNTGIERLGYLYRPELSAEIEAIDLPRCGWPGVRRISLLQSEETGPANDLRQTLEASGRLSAAQHMPTAGDWQRADGRARIARAALDTLVGWLSGGKG